MADLNPDVHAVPNTEYYEKKANGTFVSAERCYSESTQAAAWANNFDKFNPDNMEKE